MEHQSIVCGRSSSGVLINNLSLNVVSIQQLPGSSPHVARRHASSLISSLEAPRKLGEKPQGTQTLLYTLGVKDYKKNGL